MPFESAFGAPALHFETTSSTMDEARRLAAEGYPEGTIVIADWQDSGRGRTTGRRWVAARGSALLATLIAPASWKALPGLSLRIGLALASACEELLGESGEEAEDARGDEDRRGPLKIELKWPNDLMAGGRKLGGVLCESTREGLLVGFGINIGQSSFPGELEAKAASLAMISGRPVPIDRDRLAEACLRRLAIIAALGDWRIKVEKRLWMRGRRTRVATGLPDSGDSMEATILGIDEDGALLAEDEAGRLLRLHSAELSWPEER